MMIDIYTDWCGWCKKLDKDVYSNKDVQAKLTKEFIAVKLNPEKSSKNKKIAASFGTRGFPHIVFVDAAGTKLSEIGGYQPADAFLKSLEAVTKKAAAK
jgi:thioredoxin-related protein